MEALLPCFIAFEAELGWEEFAVLMPSSAQLFPNAPKSKYIN